MSVYVSLYKFNIYDQNGVLYGMSGGETLEEAQIAFNKFCKKFRLNVEDYYLEEDNVSKMIRQCMEENPERYQEIEEQIRKINDK